MSRDNELSSASLRYYPFVSIIVPVYNASITLSLCLESILKLDYPSDRHELIVVDNGSKDETPEIAQKFGARVLYETSKQSSYAARNKGIIEAKGQLLAFTDSDCVVTPGWLKHLIQYWDDTSIGCFAGEVEAYKPETLLEKFADRSGILRQNVTLKCPYLPYTQTANSAYRSEVFEKIGLFNAELVSGGDADISWRMQREMGLQIKFIPDALVYHKHRANLKDLFRQFKKYEYGKLLWKRYYPDYKLPPLRKRVIDVVKASAFALAILPFNLSKYTRKQIDIVDLASPFFRVVMAFGTLSARIRKTTALNKDNL